MRLKNNRSLLTVNCGFSSLKFSLFLIEEADSPTSTYPTHPVYRGECIRIGESGELSIRDAEGEEVYQQFSMAVDHEHALRLVLAWLDEEPLGTRLSLVGHRFVHGGKRYQAPVLIDDEVLDYLEELIPLAPNHQPLNIQGVRLLQELKPELPQVACFDTAFHTTRPAVEQRFALPRTGVLSEVRSYGFHGLSFEYIARELPEYLGVAATGKVVVAHLGHDASLCALDNRRSVATTMTFTPLDGIPMGTRCGAIDPAVVLYLQQRGMQTSQISDLLYFRSGMLGVSGVSDDVEVLLGKRSANARFAIEMFVHRTVRAIGSMAAAMGGIDALVFTAGIGEKAPAIRADICERLEWMGVSLDKRANHRGGPRITSGKSAVHAWVIPADEERMIAEHACMLMKKRQSEMA